MATKKVVPGSLTEAYKKREGDFSPSLVGNQFTDPNAFFTLGNFSITSNFEGRPAKDFKIGEWSNYYDLDDLEMTESELDQMVSNNIFVKINFDKTNINKYVYFGSFQKLLESEIEDIIIKWPASIHISPNPVEATTSRPTNINTVLDFVYDETTNISLFKTPVKAVNNPYGLDFSNDFFGDDNIVSQIYNYVLFNEESEEYNIINMTGFTNNSNYIYFKITGNPFKSMSANTFSQKQFHIKPVKNIINKFFNNLTDLQNLLLNRLTIPKYTFNADIPIKYDDGDIGFTKKSFTWPTSDGYNLDINTLSYGNYIENFFNIASLYDQNITDLVVRRLVSDSIVEYDTEGDNTEQSGMKVSKLLRIYGAEFDLVKKYINGISFANVVTYNKKDNTSDNLIKIMAKTMGFDVMLTNSGGFSLLENNDPGDDPQFNGYARELSPKEIDTELWRRLVINAWWLFRSKGTRKVLEFFMSLFKINNCSLSMDERVYVVKDKLNIFKLRSEITKLLGVDYFDNSRNEIPVDSYGFPLIPQNTNTYWFQNDGFWYNGGNDSTQGNNPHYGVYDYGQRYFDRLKCFIQDFQPVTQIQRNEIIKTNYFTDYNSGTFSPNIDGAPLSVYGDIIPNTLLNPTDNINVISAGLVVYGEENGPKNVRDSGDTYSYRITFQAGEIDSCRDCLPESLFSENGVIYVKDEYGKLQLSDNEECCDFYWLPLNTEIDLDDDIITDITENSAIKSLSETKSLNYVCWWCPEQQHITTVCDSITYLNTLQLTDYQIIKESNGYGYNGNDLTTATNYLTSIYDTYFNGNRCVYMINNKPLKNKDCCELRGGEWNETSQLCEIVTNNDDTCTPDNITFLHDLVGKPIDSSKEVEKENFVVLDESCCNSLGYYYGDINKIIYKLDGTTEIKQTNFQSIQFLQPNTNGCFVCPIEYKEVLTSTVNGDTLIITDLNNDQISESCCRDLGFNYGVVEINKSLVNSCFKCSTNILLDNKSNTITNIDGSNLDEFCCNKNGYYYSNNECHLCPPFLNGNYIITNKTINNVIYNVITDFNGNDLTEKCCLYYRTQSGNPTVVHDKQIGCFTI